MKPVYFLFVFFAAMPAQARPNYFNLFVPQALTNLGVTTIGWDGNCLNCHGTNTAFGDYNNTFGQAFVGQAGVLGFALTANGADDLTQAQVQQIINALLNQDSDADTHDNRAEFVAFSNVADPL